MRSPFVTRDHLLRVEDRLANRLFQLSQALAANGILRRRVASLELENSELRRRLEERDA